MLVQNSFKCQEHCTIQLLRTESGFMPLNGESNQVVLAVIYVNTLVLSASAVFHPLRTF